MMAVPGVVRALEDQKRAVVGRDFGDVIIDVVGVTQDAQAAAEATRLELVDLSFRNGAASSLDLLDAQRATFAAQQAALQVRLAQLQNQVQLYKVLGGGVDAPRQSGG